MKHAFLTTQAELEQACRRFAQLPVLAFDTEFVAEDTYRPVLCLVQVAAGDELLSIDPLAIDDLTPFWELIATPGRETIVHAGRQEVLFCLEAVGRAPAGLYDVQLAAGMIGLEYPAGYGSLVGKLLGNKMHKGETRTDWRRRPLSSAQLEYALDDVRHLHAIRSVLGEKLDRLQRTTWFEQEQQQWLTDLDTALAGERWRRVSGSAGLSSSSLAVVRAVWEWREEEASRRNRPVRQVLRDDLIVELAKRRSADPRQIQAIRGMERGDIRRILPELSAAIERALKLTDEQCPQPVRNDTNSHLTMLGQFLSSALGSICRKAEVATSLVGTPSDVRDLIAWRLENGARRKPPPRLAQGWRAQVVGQLLDDILSGRIAIRVVDPESDHPLAFESLPE